MDLTTLVPAFGGVIWTVLAFVVALSIIVAVHEYGHYIVGRWTGIHAEVFSLGFGPVLYSRVDKRGTKWQLAALPFGGYVKFLGDADAASAKDGQVMSSMSPAELRHTMHGAPLWARSLTVAAGPVFNFALTILVFCGAVWWNGVAVDQPTVSTLRATPAAVAGLLPGDVVLAIAGIETPDLAAYGAALDKVPLQPVIDYRVQRGDQTLVVQGAHPLPPIAASVHPQSAAREAGLQPGDVILTMDGVTISTFDQMPALVEAAAGKPMAVGVWRAGETFDLTLTPRRRDLPTADGGFETRWLLGLSGGNLFEFAARTPGPLETVQLAVEQTWYVGKTTVSGLWHIATGAISSCNISGPIGMARVMGDAARSGFEVFFQTLAVLSLGIGLLNLFPIPVLDGGHLVFHAWEAVSGKPPSDRALRVLMTAGLTLLLGLMAFALSNDLLCT